MMMMPAALPFDVVGAAQIESAAQVRRISDARESHSSIQNQD